MIFYEMFFEVKISQKIVYDLGLYSGSDMVIKIGPNQEASIS